MTTRWLKFRTVLEEVAVTQNLDPTLGQLDSAVVQRRLAQAINMAVEVAWKYHLWPEAAWLVDAVTTPNWAAYFEQGSAVVASFKENPIEAWRAGRDPKRRNWREGPGANTTPDDSAAVVYHLVRMAPPGFGVDARDNAAAYEKGEMIYDAATGECWRAQQAHTGQAPAAAWAHWVQGEEVGEINFPVWHNGWLYQSNYASENLPEEEPLAGANWFAAWDYDDEFWTPQRLPHYLLPAVLAGARAWLDSPDTEAMERAMQGALSTQVQDRVYTRKQATPMMPAGPGFAIS